MSRDGSDSIRSVRAGADFCCHFEDAAFTDRSGRTQARLTITGRISRQPIAPDGASGEVTGKDTSGVGQPMKDAAITINRQLFGSILQAKPQPLYCGDFQAHAEPVHAELTYGQYNDA
jgi:hypothetical protein